MKKVKKQMLNVVLFTLLFVIIACVTIGTYAWFTDQKSFSTNELKFGTITLNVTGDSISGENLNVVVTRSVGDLTGQLMPGDTVSLKFNVTLNTGCEPAYYLVSLTGAENLFDESCFYYDSTTKTVVSPTTESPTVGSLTAGTTHTFNLTKQISTDYETQGESVSITLEVYAIQQANLTVEEAYNKLNLSLNGVDLPTISALKSAISNWSSLKSCGFYYTKDVPADFNLDTDLTNNLNVANIKVYKKSDTEIAVASDYRINAPESCADMFSFNFSITSVGLSNFDTSKVTDMSGMFGYTMGITDLDVSGFNTSKVTDMSRMFNGVKGSLDVSNFDTSKVNNMSNMFGSCSSLTILDLSNFDTSNVTDMSGMFANCSSLISLNLTSFNTSNVTDMNIMFGGCSKLTSLNVSNFDTSKVTNMNQMFYNCSSLTSLDLSNFDTSKVNGEGKWMNMFNGALVSSSSSTLTISDKFVIDGSNTFDKATLKTKTSFNTNVTVIRGTETLA